MREHCEYHFECICGASIVSISAEGSCKKCNRLFAVERQTEVREIKDNNLERAKERAKDETRQ